MLKSRENKKVSDIRAPIKSLKLKTITTKLASLKVGHCLIARRARRKGVLGENASGKF